MKTTVEFSVHAIERAKVGDPGAFEALYREHRRSVYALCLRKTNDVGDAEDLTQEVFLQVYQKVNSLRDEVAFKSWLFRVTMNIILMHFRKRRPWASSFYFLDSETSSVLDVSEALTCPGCEPAERIALARAIGGLPKCRRTVLVLHDIEGMSHREIAESLGVSLNTAKSNLCRARRQLRGILLDGRSTMRRSPDLHSALLHATRARMIQ
jgi:RNA polymerase sigma-70 factor, ECF subfamily